MQPVKWHYGYMKFPEIKHSGMQTKVYKTLHHGKYFISGENWPGGHKRYSINRLNEDGSYTVIEFRIYSSRESAIEKLNKLVELKRL